MTDERTRSLPGADMNEIDPEAEPRPTTDRDDTPESPDSDDASKTNPLLREGPDAPDAADIEDPDEQL